MASGPRCQELHCLAAMQAKTERRKFHAKLRPKDCGAHTFGPGVLRAGR